jgi:HD superfamily phosphodiesterase
MQASLKKQASKLGVTNLSPYIEYCAQETRKYDASHNLEHHLKVALNTLQILRDEPVEVLNMGIIAAISHDIVDAKYLKDDPSKPKRLRQFLETILGRETMEDIMWIIDNMSYSKEMKYGIPVHANPLVNKAREGIVDGDRIEACDIQRCIDYTKTKQPHLTKDEHNRAVAKHCYEKLLHVCDSIKSAKGKELAGRKIGEIRNFVKNYEKKGIMLFTESEKKALRESYGK